MEWTTEPPTIEGTYWAYREQNGVEVAEVVPEYEYPRDLGLDKKQIGFECLPIYDDFKRPLDYYTHWYGPIEKPSPPRSKV